jgi:uncharacterized membrane protein
MLEHRLHSLAIVTLLVVAGPWQLSGLAAAQTDDREGAFTNVLAESPDSALEPAKTKIYKFRSIDVPGAFWSLVYDYNGTIAVGASYDAPTSNSSAFFFKSNVYKAIKPASSATNSFAFGVNKSGQIVGFYTDALGTFHGFISDGTNTSSFDYPGATGTTMLGINDSGDIAGGFSQGGNSEGFLYNKNKNTFTPINYPSATETHAYGVNSSDVVVGWYKDTGGKEHGFVWNSGNYSSLDYPGAGWTNALGINDADLIAGTYQSGGFPHGFLFDGKTYTTVDVPNGTETTLSKVNSNKNVVGIVVDSFGNYHGVIGR